jgi:hypothetical protein
MHLKLLEKQEQTKTPKSADEQNNKDQDWDQLDRNKTNYTKNQWKKMVLWKD